MTTAQVVEAVAVGVVLAPALALAAAFAKEVARRVVGALLAALFVSHVVQGDGSVAVHEFLRKRGSLRGGTRRSTWQRIQVHVRPEGSERNIFFRLLSASNALMFYGGWPILHLVSENQNGDQRQARYYHLRWTVDWERMLREVQDADVADPRSASGGIRYRIARYTGSRLPRDRGKPGYETAYAAMPTMPPSAPGGGMVDWRPLGYEWGEIGPPNPPDPFRHLALGSEAQRVIRDAGFWLQHREWYREREMSWRWGCLLKGPPGTGKTSLVRGVAQRLDLPVVVADMATLENYDLSSGLRDAIGGASPCALLLEDVDNVFHGRENVAKDSGLTFDALLNFLDGVEGLDGVITFVTTNRPELLDAALTRPGRLDLHVELPGLDAAGRLRVALFILGDCAEAEALAKESRDGESPAEFKERCCKRAREILWGQT